MGKLKNIKTAPEIIKSPKSGLQELTRHNPKTKEVQNQLKIVRSTKKLEKRTEIIPETKESLAVVKKGNEKSREKTAKATDNNMGKGGGGSTGNSGKKSGKAVPLKPSAEAAKKTSAQMKVLEKSGLELSEHEEVAETHLQTWNDEKLLAAKVKEINKTSASLKKHKGLIKYFAGSGGGMPKKPAEIMNRLAEEFVISETDKEGKIKKDKNGNPIRRFKTLIEFVSGKSEKDMSFFEKAKAYWNAFWSRKLFLYQGIKKKAEKEILFWDFGKEKVEKYEEVYHGAEEKIEKGIGMAKNLNPEVKRLRDTVSNPALRTFIANKNGKTKYILKNMAIDGPHKFRGDLANEFADINKQGLNKFGKEWMEAVQGGHVHGMELVNGKGVKIPKGAKINGLRAGGRMAFFRVSAETIKAALRTRSWGPFKATVTNSAWLSNTAEMLPIYGTIASLKRLNDFSTGTSQKFRKFEFALNLAFDLITIIPFILATSVSVGTATPLVLGIRMAAGRGIKFLAKYLTKASPRIIKWIVSKIPKLARKAAAKQEALLIKEGARVGSKKLAQKGLRQGSKKASQEIAEVGAKNTAKSIAKKNRMWREIKWTAGSEGLVEGVNVAVDKKDKILDFAINMSKFSKTQKKVIKMASHKMAA